MVCSVSGLRYYGVFSGLDSDLSSGIGLSSLNAGEGIRPDHPDIP
ncbi:hypothetical protein F6453_2155 [Marinobacter nauticus]|uniref:Uncharacterized protein n=1 Tax=Marinobacter nauticus TaxID=2743 RepID=A0A833N9D6_MARNT|nr:hypothetical protein F6453_2155 [Marinobacter nauticus]